MGAQNPKARQAKSKARLARFDEMSQRRLPEAQRDARNLHPGRPTARRQGHRVPGGQQGLRRPPADRQLSFTVPPGAIVGIIGPNGAGKSTLFRMITGQEKPDAAKS
jgi:sulfate-transporting ATPase